MKSWCRQHKAQCFNWAFLIPHPLQHPLLPLANQITYHPLPRLTPVQGQASSIPPLQPARQALFYSTVGHPVPSLMLAESDGQATAGSEFPPVVYKVHTYASNGDITQNTCLKETVKFAVNFVEACCFS